MYYIIGNIINMESFCCKLDVDVSNNNSIIITHFDFIIDMYLTTFVLVYTFFRATRELLHQHQSSKLSSDNNFDYFVEECIVLSVVIVLSVLFSFFEIIPSIKWKSYNQLTLFIWHVLNTSYRFYTNMRKYLKIAMKQIYITERQPKFKRSIDE